MFLHLSVSHSVHGGGVFPSIYWGRQPPLLQMAIAADGTHLTGMHSCFQRILSLWWPPRCTTTSIYRKYRSATRPASPSASRPRATRTWRSLPSTVTPRGKPTVSGDIYNDDLNINSKNSWDRSIISSAIAAFPIAQKSPFLTCNAICIPEFIHLYVPLDFQISVPFLKILHECSWNTKS